MGKKILIGIIAILVIIQFFGIDKDVPEFDKSRGFISQTNPPENVSAIIQNACYDCHSYETKYPWYTNIEPVSWFLGSHIKEGREHLNFSLWLDYSPETREHKLVEANELVGIGEMPLKSYTYMHKEADLSDEEQKILQEWLIKKSKEISGDESEDLEEHEEQGEHEDHEH